MMIKAIATRRVSAMIRAVRWKSRRPLVKHPRNALGAVLDSVRIQALLLLANPHDYSASYPTALRDEEDSIFVV